MTKITKEKEEEENVSRRSKSIGEDKIDHQCKTERQVCVCVDMLKILYQI